jgi:hypothetical protein
MVSDDEISSAKTFIFLVVGVMSGWYAGERGGKAGKKFVYDISSSMDDTLIQQLLGLLFQRDFVATIGAMVGTFVGCAIPPAVVFYLSDGITKILKKWADKIEEERRRQQKYTAEDQHNETEEDKDDETETKFTKSKGNKNRSNKKKKNKKPKPNNKRQFYGTQNKEEKKEMEKIKLLEMEKQKLSRMIYELLGEKPGPTMDEIKSRYRHMTLKYHPDKGGSYDDWHRLEKAMEIIKEHIPT